MEEAKVTSQIKQASRNNQMQIADNRSEKEISIDHVKAKTSAKERAEEIRQNLNLKHPSFVKTMHRTNVSSNYWLSIPKQFNNSYLPKAEVMITLIDEKDVESKVKYIGMAFSAGWSGFAIAHKLVEGDILVFELVTETTFKVYITRAAASDRHNELPVISNLDNHPKRNSPCLKLIKSLIPKRKRKKILPLTELEQRGTKRLKYNCGKVGFEVSGNAILPLTDLEPRRTERMKYNNGEVGLEVSGNAILPLTDLEPRKTEIFKCNSGEVNLEVLESAMSWTTKDRKKFDAALRSSRKQSKLPKKTWAKYYKLCCTRKTFLHKKLLRYNTLLLDGIIKQTVAIADSIISCKLSMWSDKQFHSWDSCLKGFEELGMDVGFLRGKLKQLRKFASISEHRSLSKRHTEAIANRIALQKERKSLKKKLAVNKEASEKLGSEIDKLVMKIEKEELEFQKEV